MAFVDPDESGFIDPDEEQKPKTNDIHGYKKAYEKYSRQYDADAARPQIPGAMRPKKMSEAEYLADKDKTYIDRLLGIPDAALSFLTSIPAMINATGGGLVKGLSSGSSKDAEKEFNRLLEEKTWTPRTESGAKYMEGLGYALQPFGLAPYLAPMGPMRGRAKKPVAPSIGDKLAAEVPKETVKVPEHGPIDFVEPDMMDLVPKEETPFRYEGAVDAPELLGKEQIRTTIDPRAEQAAKAAETERKIYEAMDPEIVQELKRHEPSNVESAFSKLEQEALSKKHLEENAAWAVREDSIPERRMAEERAARMEDSLYDIQDKLTQGMRGKQRGALDFQTIVDQFPDFAGSVIKKPLYRGVRSDYTNAERPMPGMLGNAIYYTANPNKASMYADSVNGGNIRQHFVNIQKPFEVADDAAVRSRINRMNLQQRTAFTQRLQKQGYDSVVLRDGKGNIDEVAVFKPEQVQNAFTTPKLNTGMARGQKGAINTKDIADGLKKFRSRFGEPKDTVKTPTSEENILKKQELARKVETVENILGEKLPEFSDPQTFEEAAALSRKAKDISNYSSAATRSMASGLNFMAAYHNNPLLRYARKLITDARAEVTTFSRKYITAENGITANIKKLTDQEKVDVNALITHNDKNKIPYTLEQAERLGLSENVRTFMEAYTKAFDANWEWHKKVTGSQGVNIAPKREGYAPSVFSGDYHSFVMDGDGNVVGIIATDSPGEFMLAKKYYQEKHPEAKFSAETWQQARRGFAGTQHTAFKYKNLNEMLALLAKADGDFSKIQMAIAQDAVRASTELFNMDVHNLGKKGITGNEGNKPWLNPLKNAKQRLDSVVKYLEDSAEYNALQKASEELRLLTADESTAHMPKAKEYLDKYFQNVSGTYINNAGKILNLAFDSTSFAAEAIAAHIPGARDYMGPGNVLKLSNVVKNKMAQIYMGWFNWMFTLSQLAQPAQTGLPIIELTANRLGIPITTAAQAMPKGLTSLIRAQLGRMGVLDVDPRLEKILAYGEDRGILDFTELERAYEGHKSKVGRWADKTAEFSMQAGETATRPPMFFAFVELLSNAEPNLDRVLPVAEHLTAQAMADYHKWERPLMYNGLGVLAPHAGGLTTFKHNFMGTQALLAKEAAGIKKGDLRSIAPIAMSASTMIGLAGITGVPFYDELNTIYEQIREKWSGERRSITQDFIKDMPEWMQNGAVSSILELNMQGKFSSANLVPDTLGQAAFPHLSGAYTMGKDVAGFISNPNQTTAATAATSVLPSSAKQAGNMLLRRDDEGYLIDKKGMRDVHRTDAEWKASAITGLTPLKEARTKTSRYQNIENEQARKRKLTETSQSFKAAIIANESPIVIAKILNDYEKAGGDVPALLKTIPQIQREAQTPTDERLRGVPKTRQGIRRYEAYDQ